MKLTQKKAEPRAEREIPNYTVIRPPQPGLSRDFSIKNDHKFLFVWFFLKPISGDFVSHVVSPESCLMGHLL